MKRKRKNKHKKKNKWEQMRIRVFWCYPDEFEVFFCQWNQTRFGGRPVGNDNGNHPLIAKNLSQRFIQCFSMCVCVCVCLSQCLYICVSVWGREGKSSGRREEKSVRAVLCWITATMGNRVKTEIQAQSSADRADMTTAVTRAGSDSPVTSPLRHYCYLFPDCH